MEDKYQVLWNKMNSGQHYTATQLNVAGATMTAMVRRNLVAKIETKKGPARYVKIGGEQIPPYDDTERIANIQQVLKDNPATSFGVVYSTGGFDACFLRNGKVTGAYGEPRDLRNADTMYANGKKFKI